MYIQSEIDKCTKNQKLGSICYAKRHSFKLIKLRIIKMFSMKINLISMKKIELILKDIKIL